MAALVSAVATAAPAALAAVTVRRYKRQILPVSNLRPSIVPMLFAGKNRSLFFTSWTP